MKFKVFSLNKGVITLQTRAACHNKENNATTITKEEKREILGYALALGGESSLLPGWETCGSAALGSTPIDLVSTSFTFEQHLWPQEQHT